VIFLFSDRVIYARKGADESGGGTNIENGEKITQELASVSHTVLHAELQAEMKSSTSPHPPKLD
jgi:hypothetical protein